MGDTMEIPSEQLSRLNDFGAWLRVNGVAICETVPWRQADATTADGMQVRFTSGRADVNVLILGRPTGSTLTVSGVKLAGCGRLLSDGSPVAVSVGENGTMLTCAHALDGSYAHAVLTLTRATIAVGFLHRWLFGISSGTARLSA